MALVSPGVEVNIIDQSQYLPAASNSVPLILLATAQNKANAAGTGVAAATTKANANKLYQVTSQRDLVNLYGNPFFYKTNTNVPIQGYELNEYGLLAAYSLLASSNRCYVLRADIDLASLVGTISRPVGAPADGTYWLDTTSSDWGIFEWNPTTQKFVNKEPIVINDGSSYPNPALGNIGDYAVLASPSPSPLPNISTYYHKTLDNTWAEVGTPEWNLGNPSITGSITNPTMVAGNIFTVNISNRCTISVTVPASPNNTLQGVVQAINASGVDEVIAENVNGKLWIYSNQVQDNSFVEFINQTGTPVEALGLINNKRYYQNSVFYGTSAQMPLWGASQSMPRSGTSLWIKTTNVGNGINLLLSQYSQTLGTYVSETVNVYPSDIAATASLDSSGGKSIPQDTIYASYGAGINLLYAPIRLFKRIAPGPTVATGIYTNPNFPSGATFTVRSSIPGTGTWSPYVTVTLPISNQVTPYDFVTAWGAAGIPYTTATLTTDLAIQLTHTHGGEIEINDNNNGVGTNVLSTAGFSVSIGNVSFGSLDVYTNYGALPTGGTGSAAVFEITSSAQDYILNPTFVNAGTGYTAGDVLVVPGVQLGGVNGVNDCRIVVLAVAGGGQIISASVLRSSVANPRFVSLVSNWKELDYIANEGAPAANPANNTNWFYSDTTEVDILVNQGGVWKGYRNTSYDNTGSPKPTGTPGTNPTGPITTADMPTTQTDGTPLVYGDLWIDSNDLENYPVISRWENVDGIDQWILIDTTDQVSSNGIVFADARWGSSGSVDPVNDPIPSITGLLTSNYVDLDCPDPALYPQGMLLWNTRRSSYNVKQFKTNYFTAIKYPGQQLPVVSYTWVSASGLKADGSPYMGRKAQRNMVVQALKASITTSLSIREEDTFLNLLAAPGYVELQPDMVALNNERNNTAYIIGDTPLRLPDQATDIQNWATNAVGATASGEDGWVTRNEYMGVFYPSGITTDLSGAQVVVPASHMMLRTFLRNDQIAYPWLAAAGTRRGTIDNATNIGYLDATTGEFQVIKNRMRLRDVLYLNQINPLAFFTGVGLLNYGNKNSKDTQSAMDRTNVARLVAYIRERLQVLARPFVFEPNDSLTRQQITGVVQSLFIDLVAKRGIYDYFVLCDTSNNFPARIDRNELWIDIAIEPVKAAEFIYIPVRILNTGALSSGG
jgi:hypothetical protein